MYMFICLHVPCTVHVCIQCEMVNAVLIKIIKKYIICVKQRAECSAKYKFAHLKKDNKTFVLILFNVL